MFWLNSCNASFTKFLSFCMCGGRDRPRARRDVAPPSSLSRRSCRARAAPDGADVHMAGGLSAGAGDSQHADNFTNLGSRYIPPTSIAEEQHENDSLLLCQLIDSVSQSIRKFRPSPSLADLSAAGHRLEEVDVVVSGGGLKGYFVIGARSVLESQLEQRNLSIKRYAGASAGAWAAMFLATGVSTADWLKSYTKTRTAFDAGDSSHVLQAYREQILPWLAKRLPADAYKRCCGRCFISISVLDRFGWLPRNLIISEYESNEDLVNACFASSCIPFVVERGFGPRFRGMRVVDGGLTNNTPCFTDNARRQIVIRLEHVPYDWRAFAVPCDPCIEALALNGALQMARFLEGREVGPAISWDSDGGRGIFEEMMPFTTWRRALVAWWQHRRRRSAMIAVCAAFLALRFIRRRRAGAQAAALGFAAAMAVRELQHYVAGSAGHRHVHAAVLSRVPSKSNEAMMVASRSQSSANLQRLL